MSLYNYKKINRLLYVPNQIIDLIKEFLENKEILYLYISCKNMLKENNLFVKLVINNDNWFDGIKRYINHRKSLKQVHLINIKNPEIFFPFYNECMDKLYIHIGNKMIK